MARLEGVEPPTTWLEARTAKFNILIILTFLTAAPATNLFQSLTMHN